MKQFLFAQAAAPVPVATPAAPAPAPAPAPAATPAAPAATTVSAAPAATTETGTVQPAGDQKPQPPQQGGGLGMFLPMLIIFAIFYFLMIKPQQRKEKERRKMIQELRAGAKVVFAGGLIGKIVEAKEHTFMIEIAGDVVIEVARNAVQGLAEDGASAESSKLKASMSFARGKFGIEYTRRPVDEMSHGLRWILVLLGILLVVSFIIARLFTRQPPTRIEPESRPSAPSAPSTPAVEPMGGTNRPAAIPPAPPAAPRAPVVPSQPKPVKPVHPPPVPPDPQASREAAKLLDTVRQRPAAERILLEKLAAAERQGETVVAIDTIKRLCDRPAVADLHPKLWERLGQLNMQLLFSERSSPWTARVTVKRGDSRDRLARDNRTTGAALERLNPNVNWSRIRPGNIVRVLQYPRAVLVIHKRLGFADLSLRGNFFHRYSFTGGAHAAAGVYPVTSEPGKSARALLRSLGVTFSPENRADLEMFLAPESSINVSDQ